MIDRKTVDDLLEKAYELIQQGDAEQAIVVGNELLKHRHARGFEIIALAHEQQGRPGEAIAILQDGTAKVPTAWPLWELMGNIYSDQEEFANAKDCFDKALACPNVDIDSVNFNIAVLLKRQGKLDEALALGEKINAPDLRLKASILGLSILNAQKRYDDVIRIGAQLVKKILAKSEVSDEEMPDVARLYAEVGRAHWDGKYDRQSAWESAWKALEWDRSDSNALWLVREIINRKSVNSKWYKLVVEGRWFFELEPDKPPPSFVTSYEVVAETVDEALNFARDLEPVEVRASMKLLKDDDMGTFPDNQQGVYWRSAYGFYN